MPRRYQIEKQNAEETTWTVHKDGYTKVQADAVATELAGIYHKMDWRVRPEGSLTEPDPGPDPEPEETPPTD